jgi:hypothetical protein
MYRLKNRGKSAYDANEEAGDPDPISASAVEERAPTGF